MDSPTVRPSGQLQKPVSLIAALLPVGLGPLASSAALTIQSTTSDPVHYIVFMFGLGHALERLCIAVRPRFLDPVDQPEAQVCEVGVVVLRVDGRGEQSLPRG